MENKETAINENNKVTETLTKELESLSNEELHARTENLLIIDILALLRA